MSTWEILSWIAFKEVRPRGDFDDAADFTLRWGHSNAGPVLEALEARAAPAPFCVVQPIVADDVPWDRNAYAHKAWSRDGPRMLRWIRATARQREGRLVTYAELAGRLRAELEAGAEEEVQVERARRELLEALRAARLTAWGKLDLRPGQPNPAAQYQAIPASIFIDELVSITEWGTVGADPHHPTAIHNYRGQSFREVRFHSAEVMAVWPSIQNAKLASASPGPKAEPQRPRGGRPAQYDWDGFWIQVAMYAAANDFVPDDRVNLQRHMQEWTAQHWPQAPDPATIRIHLKRLFDTIEGARK
jgi:hypothetical protein